MKALVAHAAKDLRIESRDAEAPAAGQVLVRVASGGICGSDLHYYNHGGFGAVRIRQPLILGHEVSGHVVSVGDGVTEFSPGQLVAVSPSRPCQDCSYCHEGKQNHCSNMRFYGSAMPFPHIQGAFQELLVADVSQCANAEGLTPGEAAMAEPLAVCLHAARIAGDLVGRRVLITGCGPIGMLCILVARRAGAAEIVVTDIAGFTLAKAIEAGADEALNVVDKPDALDRFTTGKGHFDVLFECSGISAALTGAIPALRPGGLIVQLGLGGDMNLPVQAITAKELQLRGSFRFHPEFFSGVELMRKGLIDVRPLITQTIPFEDAVNAFEIASDRSRAVKTQILFGGQ